MCPLLFETENEGYVLLEISLLKSNPVFGNELQIRFQNARQNVK